MRMAKLLPSLTVITFLIAGLSGTAWCDKFSRWKRPGS
jgi:hypothetical protein